MLHPPPRIHWERRRVWSARLAFALVACGVSRATEPPAEPVPPAYTQRNWQEREGLPSDDLVGAQQDAAGFLWVVGKGNLSRFDGTTFEPVAVPAGAVLRGFATVPASAPDRGTLVLPASRGEAGVEAGCQIRRERTFEFEPEPTLAGKAPRVVYYAPDGARWIGCEDGALLRRHGTSATRFDLPALPANNKPPAFASDAAGTVWIAWGPTIHRVEGGSLVEARLPEREAELRLASSRTGGVWLVGGTSLWRAQAGAAGFSEVQRLPDELASRFLLALLEDRHGFLWLGTRSRGLHRLAGGRFLRVPVSSDDIAGLCEDADNSLWVATDGGGLNRLRAQAHQFFDRDRGLYDNYSYTVAADRTGAVWIANRDGSVVRVQDEVVDPVARRAGWRPFSARSIHPSPTGEIWIASGLGVFRSHTDRPESLEQIAGLAALRNIRATFVARNGDYWLAVDPDRVARWRDGELTFFGAAHGFDGREVRAFAEDERGRLWLGAANGALFRATDEDRFERVTFPDADDCGPVQVIRFEDGGRMLLGTTRRGVVMLSGPDLSSVRRLDRLSGLPNNNVSQMLVDDHDRYWFATRAGIYWAPGGQVRAFASGQTGYVHTVMLGEDDGLPPLSCLGIYQPAAWKAADGTLWFATRRGVLRTDPAIVARGRDTVPAVSVTHVAFDDREQAVAAELDLAPAVRKVRLGLSALNLATPESTQLRVRLDGFDEDWAVLGADRSVTYPRLPPGRYVFSAMVSNGGGPWHRPPPLLTLVVHPAWWQTPWVRLAATTAVLAGLWAATRAWSHRRLRLRLRTVEQAGAIERERARIARDIHDDIGATLTRISLLTQTAPPPDGSHAATLAKIHESTRSVTRALNEIVWAVNPRHDNLESLVYYLGNFAQDFLGTAGIRCRLGSPNPPAATTLASQVRHSLFLACREALHNVVKHAGATEVALGIVASPGELTVTIADDGRGFDPGLPARASSGLASGNGLGNMQQHMAGLGGRCTVQPRPAGGTIVTFRVPLPPSTSADEDPTRAY